MSSTLHIERLAGPQATPWLPELARLRISVFRAYPYLYDGDTGYEENYGYTDLMVDGAPSPHQPDTTLRWLIDRPRS
ncbi:hypothetical protein CKO35_11450 [Ectothiorhodospira shaposhnikovii]|uniref:hypothetical protein n=1 Tax=Ectothiorhodospira shaposhnikovii TaxID=1054 RepID=UPI003B8A8E79|nr:hypothetical protein [Ectothiorhodospira shaposhnikovii]